MNKNKLPRKRKKALRKVISKGDYMMIRILNEVLFEQTGKPCRFPKLIKDPKYPTRYIQIGYW